MRQRDYRIINPNEAPRLLREIGDVLGWAKWWSG